MFEFDPGKSRANEEKHGIDFRRAQAIWLDPDLLRIVARARGEPRFMFIGRMDVHRAHGRADLGRGRDVPWSFDSPDLRQAGTARGGGAV